MLISIDKKCVQSYPTAVLIRIIFIALARKEPKDGSAWTARPIDADKTFDLLHSFTTVCQPKQRFQSNSHNVNMTQQQIYTCRFESPREDGVTVNSIFLSAHRQKCRHITQLCGHQWTTGAAGLASVGSRQWTEVVGSASVDPHQWTRAVGPDSVTDRRRWIRIGTPVCRPVVDVNFPLSAMAVAPDHQGKKAALAFDFIT